MTSKLLDVFTRAGAEWVMYALAALSVASLAVMILERALFFWRFGGSRADVLAPLLFAGRLEDARAVVKGRNGLEVEVVRAALYAATGGPASVAELVASTIRRERQAYERGAESAWSERLRAEAEERLQAWDTLARILRTSLPG